MIKDNYKLLSELILKSMSDNKEDNEQLRQMLSENQYSSDLIEKISSSDYFAETMKILDEAYKSRDEKMLVEKINQCKKREKLIRRRKVALFSSVAAAILVFTFYILGDHKEINYHTSTIMETKKMESRTFIKPTLIIDNSNIIELKDQNNQLIAHHYTDTIKESPVSDCRLLIPYGNTYSVILDDSTEVTLNSNSELIYPSKFTRDERKVTLKGEAFFQVKTSGKPFIVITHNSYTKVYGTSFNVNARDENSVKTVLVTGSVAVGADNMDPVLIKPNQMAVIDTKKNTRNIINIDVDKYITWKDGYFKFIDTEFSDMIAELNNWYGVNFRYDHEAFKGMKVNLSILRSGTIDNTIQFIQKIMNINFIKKGGDYKIERRK